MTLSVLLGALSVLLEALSVLLCPPAVAPVSILNQDPISPNGPIICPTSSNKGIGNPELPSITIPITPTIARIIAAIRYSRGIINIIVYKEKFFVLVQFMYYKFI